MAEDDDYTLFEPQTKLENLSYCLERILMTTQSKWQPIKYDENKWFETIENHKKDIADGLVINERYLTADNNEKKYTWKQTDDFIQIVLPNVNEEDVTINLESNSISAYGANKEYPFPVLSGVFWDKVKSFSTIQLGEITQIELTLESTDAWPILIKGMNPDGLSCFYIATLANCFNDKDAVLFYLQKGALYQNHSSTLAYALTLLDADNKPAAVNFFARGALTFGDHTCAFCLSSLLISGDGIGPNPPVAEYMLCRLCKEGFSDAYYRLALLYLKGDLGVEKMPKRAKKIMEIAAFGMNDEQALKTYQETDWDSIIQEKEDKDKKEEQEKNEYEKHKDDPTHADYLVAAGFIVGAAILGYGIYKRFFKR